MKTTSLKIAMTSLVLGAVSCLSACGVDLGDMADSDTAKNTPTINSNSDDLTAALDCSKSATTTVKTADENKIALALSDTPVTTQLRKVPAEELLVKTEDGDGKLTQQMSLCDLLRGKNKKLAFFNMIGTECYACMKWLETTTAGLKSAKYDDVLSVAIVTDKHSQLNDEQWKLLKQDVAPDALWVLDHTRALRQFFTADPEPLRPTMVVMDMVASGFLVNDATLTPAAIVTQANTLMVMDVKPTP